MTPECPACWGSHGCHLPENHPGEHECDHTGDPWWNGQPVRPDMYPDMDVFNARTFEPMPRSNP